MREEGAYGERLGERFGVHEVPALVTSTLNKTKIAVTLIESESSAEVMSEPLPPEDAYLVHLNLKPCPDHELWVDGRALGKRTFGRGETVIHDLKRNPVALIHTPMGSLMFYLARKVLDELCDDAGAPRIGELDWTAGVAVDDPIVRGLGQTLTLALRRPQEAAPIFVDHVTLALAAHVASTYGGMRSVRSGVSGGLAPWQERRAKEVLASHPDGAVSMLALAQECGLSAGHFARAFRRSVGEPPHRWLLNQRIEQAKQLLLDPDLTIADIALACGFCDQSHLTRCFKRALGVGPGAWRRHFAAGRIRSVH
jgi:AraC-like DNA-binding protein